MDVYHLISALSGITALYYSQKVKSLFGRIYSRSFVFVVFGIVLMTLSHLSELLLSGLSEHVFEHVLFSMGMLSMALSFIVLTKSLGESYKA